MTRPLPAPLILGSTSRYRRELLERLNLPFLVDAPQVDEAPQAGERPIELAARLALAKAREVSSRHPMSLVIGSDQVADLKGESIGKPGSHAKALLQLRAMSGQSVRFHTAVAVARVEPFFQATALATVNVAFRELGDLEIERYLRAEQPYDCAGSAKSEGMGIALLRAIESDDPTALIGLPLIRTCELLRQAGSTLWALDEIPLRQVDSRTHATRLWRAHIRPACRSHRGVAARHDSRCLKAETLGRRERQDEPRILKRVDSVEPLASVLQVLDIKELPRPQKGGKPAAAVGSEWQALLAPALAGNDLGLMSEAGMPAIADPGANLVRAAHIAGIEVVALPGPNSLMLALAASGLNGQSFAFVGYLPVDNAARAARIKELEAVSRRLRQTQIIIETPYRNEALLSALLAHASPTMRIAVSCGLTLPEGWTQSGTVAQWNAAPLAMPADVPAVFLLLAD